MIDGRAIPILNVAKPYNHVNPSSYLLANFGNEEFLLFIFSDDEFYGI